jgi:hypothetical protein
MKKQNTIITNLFVLVCATTATQLNGTTSNESYSASTVYPTTINCPAGQTCNYEGPIVFVNADQTTAQGAATQTTATQTKKK